MTWKIFKCILIEFDVFDLSLYTYLHKVRIKNVKVSRTLIRKLFISMELMISYFKKVYLRSSIEIITFAIRRQSWFSNIKLQKR